MSEEHLATYLNDHLAGAVAATELLEYLIKLQADKPLGMVLSELRGAIVADRAALEDLMGRLGVPVRSPRQLTAWLAERATRLKLRLDDPSGRGLGLLEGLEAVSLGIQGKRALWRALAAAAAVSPRLRALDCERMERRADEQYLRVESARLDAAKAALRVA